MEIDHTLRVQGHHVISDVEVCAEEIAEYLNDHSNWWLPIFPPVVGCSDLEVDPEYFNTSATFWVCPEQIDEGTWECERSLYKDIKLAMLIVIMLLMIRYF